jgi:hypothetical protein
MSRRGVTTALALACALAAPGAASADASLSTNWAGYAVHRTGVSFRAVSATWRQPVAVCNTSYPTYEASWVGIGGYNRNSTALEQIGTELDCSSSGAVTSAAWYELVPDPSRRIRMAVEPGDAISASVTVVGHHVTLKLTDRTRHRSFAKAVAAPSVDVRSAEWIVEAPSECSGNNSCRTLPLTDFGTVSFGGANATDTNGRRGSISSGRWGMSRITLAPAGRAYIAFGLPGEAKPSALSRGGSAFQVAFSRPTLVPASRSRVPLARAGAQDVAPGGAGGVEKRAGYRN